MTGLPCAVVLVAASFTPVSYTHLLPFFSKHLFATYQVSNIHPSMASTFLTIYSMSCQVVSLPHAVEMKMGIRDRVR